MSPYPPGTTFQPLPLQPGQTPLPPQRGHSRPSGGSAFPPWPIAPVSVDVVLRGKVGTGLGAKLLGGRPFWTVRPLSPEECVVAHGLVNPCEPSLGSASWTGPEWLPSASPRPE